MKYVTHCLFINLFNSQLEVLIKQVIYYILRNMSDCEVIIHNSGAMDGGVYHKGTSLW